MTAVGLTPRACMNPGCAASATGWRHSADMCRWAGGGGAPASTYPSPQRTGCMPERLRVVIAEDNYLVREGTRRLLEDSGEVDVLAAVGNATELLQAVDGLRPDAVLTDIRMPPGHQVEGIDAAHAIRKKHPGIGVVVLSQHSDAAYAVQLLKDGTEGLGYLLKTRVGELDEL